MLKSTTPSAHSVSLLLTDEVWLLSADERVADCYVSIMTNCRLCPRYIWVGLTRGPFRHDAAFAELTAGFWAIVWILADSSQRRDQNRWSLQKLLAGLFLHKREASGFAVYCGIDNTSNLYQEAGFNTAYNKRISREEDCGCVTPWTRC